MSSKESALDCTTARLECHCESFFSILVPFHWQWFLGTENGGGVGCLGRVVAVPNNTLR